MNQISSEKQYRKLLKELGGFFDADIPKEQIPRFEELCNLVEAYEDIHYDLGPPTLVGALKFRMEQEKLNQSDVARITGISRSRVSEILSGKREASKNIIRRLHDSLGIPLDHLFEVNEVPKPEPAARGKQECRLRAATVNHRS